MFILHQVYLQIEPSVLLATVLIVEGNFALFCLTRWRFVFLKVIFFCELCQLNGLAGWRVSRSKVVGKVRPPVPWLKKWVFPENNGN